MKQPRERMVTYPLLRPEEGQQIFVELFLCDARTELVEDLDGQAARSGGGLEHQRGTAPTSGCAANCHIPRHFSWVDLLNSWP